MHLRARNGKLLAQCVVAPALLAVVSCSGSPAEPTPASPTISTLTILYGVTACQPLRAGRVLALNVYAPANPHANVNSASTWTSSDLSVVRTQGTAGAVLMVGAGTAVVRAEHQGATASMTITIEPDAYPRLDVSVNNNFPGVAPTVRAQFVATATTSATDVTAAATFASSDTAIATVDGAGITFRPRTGNTTISATYNGASGSCGISMYPER